MDFGILGSILGSPDFGKLKFLAKTAVEGLFFG